MKIKTRELIGSALDWAVAWAQNMDYFHPDTGPAEPAYSSDWAQGGPIIERNQIGIVRCNDLYFPSGNEHGEYYEQYWKAEIKGETDLNMSLYIEYGPTPLIAAMRCFVASKLGDEVDIPNELINDNEAAYNQHQGENDVDN